MRFFVAFQFAVLTAGLGLGWARNCAVCPPVVPGSANTTAKYLFVSREIQPNNVICGSVLSIFLTGFHCPSGHTVPRGYSYEEESKRVQRNGWPYCTYDLSTVADQDMGAKIDWHLSDCPDHTRTEAWPPGAGGEENR
ncbi:hypothetical protein B0H11DRAFT_1904032 [Mycena galericulata]|nr:hypothetical protein B0H11DRAFT_1904032 [Mycena galericulata]